MAAVCTKGNRVVKKYKYYTEKWKDNGGEETISNQSAMLCLRYEFKLCNFYDSSYVGKARQHLSQRTQLLLLLLAYALSCWKNLP